MAKVLLALYIVQGPKEKKKEENLHPSAFYKECVVIIIRQ